MNFIKKEKRSRTTSDLYKKLIIMYGVEKQKQNQGNGLVINISNK